MQNNDTDHIINRRENRREIVFPAFFRPAEFVILNKISILYGVDNGTRTHDDRNHNPGLYQLSYTHHWLEAAYYGDN